MTAKPQDLLGLVAYVSLMYGKLPDREFLRDLLSGDTDEPRLRIVVRNDDPEPRERQGPYEANEEAA